MPKIEEILNEGKSKTTKGFSEKDADPKQIAMGMEVEKEHSNNPVIRKKITLDHIAEFPTYYSGLSKLEKELSKKAEDMTAPNMIQHGGDPHDDKRSIKQNLLTANRIMRLAMSPNKAMAIENSIIGSVANGIVSTISKLAAVEGFNNEMEKIAHTFDQIWSKTPLKSKIRHKVLSLVGFKSLENTEKALAGGNQIAAINAFNVPLDRTLFRKSVKNRAAAYQPLLPQKDTYTKPGQF